MSVHHLLVVVVVLQVDVAVVENLQRYRGATVLVMTSLGITTLVMTTLVITTLVITTLVIATLVIAT